MITSASLNACQPPYIINTTPKCLHW